MPLDEQTIDAAVQERLFRMNRAMKQTGFGDMSDQELQQAYGAMKQQMQQMSQQGSQSTPPQRMLSPQRQLPAYAEGGFLNDRSGQATDQLRRRMLQGSP